MARHPVPTVSQQAFVNTVGAFVDARAVGFNVGEDQFWPLPDVMKQLLDRIDELEARLAQTERK